MDYFTFVNLCWVVVVIAAVMMNFKRGYAKGVADGYEQIMLPALDLMMSKGFIVAKHTNGNDDVGPRELGEYLVNELAVRSKR